jgi:hypothetical protein
MREGSRRVNRLEDELRQEEHDRCVWGFTMVSLTAHSPAPLAAVRQRSRAAFLVAVGLRIVLAVAVFGVLAGLITSVLWVPGAPADAVPASDVCAEPPCPPESLPGVRDLPVLVAPLGYLLAALLGVAALLLSLLSEGQRRRRPLLPVLGPVVVLVAMEVVPHLVNPCLIAGMLGDLPSGCSRTVHGVDVHDRWHWLHHAVVGGLPAALAYAALLRRRRPELFAHSDDSPPPVPLR